MEIKVPKCTEFLIPVNIYCLKQAAYCKECQLIACLSCPNQCFLIGEQTIRAGISWKWQGAGLPHPHSMLNVCPFAHDRSNGGWSCTA